MIPCCAAIFIGKRAIINHLLTFQIVASRVPKKHKVGYILRTAKNPMCKAWKLSQLKIDLEQWQFFKALLWHNHEFIEMHIFMQKQCICICCYHISMLICMDRRWGRRRQICKREQVWQQRYPPNPNPLSGPSLVNMGLPAISVAQVWIMSVEIYP